MATNKQDYEILSSGQFHDIAIIIVDIYGNGLPKAELEESIALILEDISGFEVASSQTIQHVTDQVRTYYYDETNRRNQKE